MAINMKDHLVDRYLIKEYASFQLSALGFLYLVLLINQLLLHANDLLSKNVPFSYIVELLIYASPSVLLWALPFSAIVGALMALSRLTADNEILALRIYGLSLKNIIKPFFLYALFLLLLSLFISNILLPLANQGYRAVAIKIAKSQTYDIFSNNSTKKAGDQLISVDRVQEGKIEKIIIVDRDSNGRQRVLVAPTAELENSKKERLTVKLNNANAIAIADDARLLSYNHFKASTLIYNIGFTSIIPENNSIDSQTISQLFKNMRIEYARYREQQYPVMQHQNFYKSYNKALNNQENSLEADFKIYKEAQYNSYINHYFRSLFIKFYEKISLSILILIFTYLAFNVAMLMGKTGIGLGLALGVFFAVLYWFLVYIVRFAIIQYNQHLVLLFLPDLAMLGIAIFLHFRMRQ